MKKYNNYSYISPLGVISEVKKKLNKYFASNQLDESVVGLHIENCIKKLGVGALDKTYAVLYFDNFKAKLPNDFYKLNLAYRCSTDAVNSAPNDFSTTTVSNGFYHKTLKCDECSDCNKTIETFETLKIQQLGTNMSKLTLRQPTLLYVGVSKDVCVDGCPNLNARSNDEIYINGKTVASNFTAGYVFLSYYTMQMDMDETGYPLIPDEVWMTELVKSYLYFQFYDDLFNNITDETANQIANKRATYQQEYFEKLIIAQSMAIAPTKMQLLHKNIRDRNRLNPFEIGN